jgi:hypothetical protein
MFLSQSEHKVTTTSIASAQGLSMQQKQVDNILDEYKDIFSLATEVLLDPGGYWWPPTCSKFQLAHLDSF